MDERRVFKMSANDNLCNAFEPSPAISGANCGNDDADELMLVSKYYNNKL
jgi:hypothetical protein